MSPASASGSTRAINPTVHCARHSSSNDIFNSNLNLIMNEDDLIHPKYIGPPAGSLLDEVEFGLSENV